MEDYDALEELVRQETLQQLQAAWMAQQRIARAVANQKKSASITDIDMRAFLGERLSSKT